MKRNSSLKGSAGDIGGALEAIEGRLRTTADGGSTDRCWRRAYHVGTKCVGVLPQTCSGDDEFWGGFCHSGGYVVGDLSRW